MSRSGDSQTPLMVDVLKNLAAPAAHRFFSGRGSYGLDAEPEAASGVFGQISAAVADAGGTLANSDILELGPGRSLDLARLSLDAGVSSYHGVDTRIQLPDTPPGSPGDERILASEYDGRNLPQATASIDLIFSKSVLEHVRAGLISPLLEDCRRVLRPGGLAVHIVDLRDHLQICGDHETHGDWLKALRYPESEFRARFSRRSTYINRLRSCEWRQAFEDAGFATAAWHVRRDPLAASFTPDTLEPRWAGMPIEELSISWFTATIRRGP